MFDLDWIDLLVALATALVVGEWSYSRGWRDGYQQCSYRRHDQFGMEDRATYD